MFSIIDLSQAEHWDAVVRSFLNYDVQYLSNYARAFCLHGDGEPLLFYYDDGNTRAINVFMKRDISAAGIISLEPSCWFDIVTPYGYGGFLIEGTNFEAVFKSYEHFCSSEGFVCEFVRFNLFSDYQKYFNGTVVSVSNNVVRSLLCSIEQIQMEFEHKVRKNLKKALGSGLSIEIDFSGKRFADFYEIYRKTMSRTGADASYHFGRNFFESIGKMQGNFVYFHVLKDCKVISSELVLLGPANCYSFLGGTDVDYFEFRPNDYLKYEIILWAKKMKLKNFVLGGGYGQDDGIYRYKKSFAPNGIHKFYVGKRIFSKTKYDKLVELRQKAKPLDLNSSFFPLYRA